VIRFGAMFMIPQQPISSLVRFFMIREITQSSYLGVLCSRCEERIPVPRTTALLYEELKRGEVSEGQDAKSRAFTLRCKVCNEESVYGVKEILEFEGPRRVRASEGKRASAVHA
jgi:hypothetical protein